MKAARELIRCCTEAGIDLVPNGTRLRWRSASIPPIVRLPPELRLELEARRGAVIEELSLQLEEGTRCAECGTTSATVYLGMDGGEDGRPWALCASCWRR